MGQIFEFFETVLINIVNSILQTGFNKCGSFRMETATG